MYHQEKGLFYSGHEIGIEAVSGVQAAKLDRAYTPTNRETAQTSRATPDLVFITVARQGPQKHLTWVDRNHSNSSTHAATEPRSKGTA
jgi:hypothetical protein